MVLFQPSASAAQEPARVLGPDCRYVPAPVASARTRRGVAFPDNDLFAPLLADTKEPRFLISYRRVQFRDSALPAGNEGPGIDAGVISAGGTFGLWAHRSVDACDGVQVSLFGGMFSQFNLDAPSLDLINSDFVIGTQLAVRHGRLSGRLRVYHQSSHLGDEFVLRNPSTTRIDFGFLAIHGLASYERAWWRAYGGGGYLFYQTSGLEPGLLQGGAEVWGPRSTRRAIRPVAGFDVTSLQARGWGVTTTASAGIEWTSPSAIRRMRMLAFGAHGYIPFGQFSIQQRLRTVGVQLQIEF